MSFELWSLIFDSQRRVFRLLPLLEQLGTMGPVLVSLLRLRAVVLLLAKSVRSLLNADRECGGVALEAFPRSHQGAVREYRSWPCNGSGRLDSQVSYHVPKNCPKNFYHVPTTSKPGLSSNTGSDMLVLLRKATLALQLLVDTAALRVWLVQIGTGSMLNLH
jgi:hypothetical protein